MTIAAMLPWLIGILVTVLIALVGWMLMANQRVRSAEAEKRVTLLREGLSGIVENRKAISEMQTSQAEQSQRLESLDREIRERLERIEGQLSRHIETPATPARAKRAR